MNIDMVVQNGTSLTSSEISSNNADSTLSTTNYKSEREKYVDQFTLFAVKTAQSTLEMCRVVYEAEKELGSQEFLKFCNEIGRKGQDATVRKYLRIGEKYEQLHQYANLLPNSWTSIYEITQLPSEVFDALVATDSSMANMTGNQIKLLKGIKSDRKSNAALNVHSSKNGAEAPDDSSAASSESEASETAKASSEASCNSQSTVVDKSSKEKFKKMFESMSRVPSIDIKQTPYEILIQFKSAPSDNTWWDLVEGIEELIERSNFDVDVQETRPEFV